MDSVLAKSKLLSVQEASRFLGVSVSWLNKMRLRGGGCPYRKLGRRVLYDQRDIDEWSASQRRTNTSQS